MSLLLIKLDSSYTVLMMGEGVTVLKDRFRTASLAGEKSTYDSKVQCINMFEATLSSRD